MGGQRSFMVMGLLVVAAGVIWIAVDSPGTSRGLEPSARGPGSDAGRDRGFVGSAACGRCHQEQHQGWLGSHHERAMGPPISDRVRGRFDGRSFDHYGTVATFQNLDGVPVVSETPSAGGYAEVAFTFGWEPLQQYLVRRPDGRLQSLPYCWDTRDVAEGGQRWFHLYPDGPVLAGEPLHWLGPDQNANFMCIDCHTTGMRRGYDAAADRFETTWAEHHVGCEACHGPGRDHVAWAESTGADPEIRSGLPATSLGLVHSLRGLPGARWVLDAATGMAKRSGDLPGAQQVDTCARCHSRRTQIAENDAGGPLLDAYAPAWIREGLYFPDGQIRDEVYVYGSFLQSKMHGAGVVCSDCHEPHGLGLRSDGNTVCYRCHGPDRFDVPSHHHHTPGEPGSFCVDCHMPERTYMSVDPRRDHSIRIPRPDVSLRLGTPNACQNCHQQEGAAFAAEALVRWGQAPSSEPTFGDDLAAWWRGSAAAGTRLRQWIANPALPSILRGSALEALGTDPSVPVDDLVTQLAADSDPLLRWAASGALDRAAVPPEVWDRLLNDPVLAVRMEAGRRLVGRDLPSLPTGLAAARDHAVAEFVQSQQLMGDRAFAHVELGNLWRDAGRLDDAAASFALARQRDPHHGPGWVNGADLCRERGDDPGCVALLSEGLRFLPEDPSLLLARGLAEVRLGHQDAALSDLRRAAAAAPDNARMGYTLGVALVSFNFPVEGREALERILVHHPEDPAILQMLVQTCWALQDRAAAAEHFREWRRVGPNHPDMASWERQLAGR